MPHIMCFLVNKCHDISMVWLFSWSLKPERFYARNICPNDVQKLYKRYTQSKAECIAQKKWTQGDINYTRKTRHSSNENHQTTQLKMVYFCKRKYSLYIS